MRDEAVDALRALNEVVERLRAPGGCPWDREQTHRTLRPYLLEETYEVLDAIDNRGEATLREELGDLLLQVLMHAAIAQEREDGFDIGDVAEVTRAKMVHRHPHVFGETVVSGAADVVVNWEKLKRSEKQERLSLLDGVPHAMPALAYAHGVQKRPARVGFDETPSVQAALARLRDALTGVEAIAASEPPAAARGQDWSVSEGEVARRSAASAAASGVAGASVPLEDALGELLFEVVALARQLRVNPEESLRRRTTMFADRFRALEARAREDGVDLHALDITEWRRRWREAGAPNSA
ncbi:MAG: nucleoside triphosphate pyrophosphohydrolase [Candidatus Dormibacteraeota bacterium]|nr:nucleoside triphosphate pyrophosphohydrolase [Candidatus Dormibacteraeota bacterium]